MKITLATFRRVDAAEETMMRACMPRTAAADVAALPVRFAPAAFEIVARRGAVRLVRPLTFTLAEAVRNA